MGDSINQAFNPSNSNSFFKDPQRMEKLETARGDLEKAKAGNHEELEKLKAEQGREKNKELGPAIQQAEATKAKLEQAESNLQQTEQKVKEMEQSAPGEHKRAAQEGTQLRKELQGMKGPDGSSLALQTDQSYNQVQHGTQELSRLEAQRNRPGQSESMKNLYDKRIAETRQKMEKAQQQLDKLKNDPKFGDKIQRYTQLRDQFTSTKPENVKKSAESQLGQARGQLNQARQANQQADQALKAGEQKFAEGRGAEQAQELKQAQNELVQNLENQVNDLSTIKREDLSEGITKSSAFGGQYGDFEAKMDGDQLKINNNGRDVTVNKNDDGFDLSSAGGRHSRDSQMVQDADGTWREAKTNTKEWSNEQARLKNEDPYKTSSTERFEDGSSVSKTHSEYDAEHVGHVIDDTVSSTSANGRRETNRRTQYEDATRETQSVVNPDKTSSYSERYATNDGSHWQEKTRVDNGKDGKFESERTYHENQYNEKGVHGIGWFPGRSPEELRGALGKDHRYGVITESTRTTGPDGRTEYGGNKTHRWSSKDGDRFLDFQKGQNGMPDTYTYNKPGMSQTFYRGTNDTSITTQSTDKDGFKVTKTREDMREMAQAVNEATDGKTKLDVGGETTLREKEDATVKDLEKLIGDSSGLRRMQESDAYKEFLEHMGNDKFNLASRESMTSKDPGKQDDGELYNAALNPHQNTQQVMAVAPDGSRLVMNYDSKTGNRVAQFVKPGEGGGEGQDYNALSMMNNRGNRLEFNTDGDAHRITANGVRTALKDADLAGATGIKAPRYGVEAAKKLRSLTAAGKSDPGEFLKGLQKIDGKYGDTFARGFDGVASLLSSANAYADASQGNWGKAARSYASALNDLGGVATGAATGTSSATGKFGQMMGVRQANNLTKIGSLGRFLGVAGAVANAGFGAYDLYNGDYLRGGLGMAAAGGSALGMLWGGAGWTGPVGWGIAAAASAGILAVDYIDSTSIADPAPGLLRAS